MRLLWKILALVVVIAVGLGIWWKFRAAKPISFRTEEIKRGELLATIGATGPIEPEEVVDVGAQVAGIIVNFGPDRDAKGKTVDYRTHVRQGDILAQIDPTLYQADLDSAQANVDAADANVKKCEADVAQSQAKLDQANREWERAQKIGPSDALSQNDYDTYRANAEIAKAALGVSQATLDQAKTQVTQAKAAMVRARQNLDYCTIKSPVNGVIIDRRVNIGQTVVAALNAPSLFLIAKDLTKMQVWASVNEADVENIHPNQPVTYTVDALPGRTFRGKVIKVRYNANMTQNVVTYVVEIGIDNPGELLKPYSTANVQFQVADHKEALLIPNAALRWYPDDNQISAAGKAELAKQEHHGGHHGGKKSATDEAKASTGSATRPEDEQEEATPPKFGYVWVKDGLEVKPIRVRLGFSDGTSTEAIGGELKEGDAVITGEETAGADAGGGNRSPFMPQFGKRH